MTWRHYYYGVVWELTHRTFLSTSPQTRVPHGAMGPFLDNFIRSYRVKKSAKKLYGLFVLVKKRVCHTKIVTPYNVMSSFAASISPPIPLTKKWQTSEKRLKYMFPLKKWAMDILLHLKHFSVHHLKLPQTRVSNFLPFSLIRNLGLGLASSFLKFSPLGELKVS